MESGFSMKVCIPALMICNSTSLLNDPRQNGGIPAMMKHYIIMRLHYHTSVTQMEWRITTSEIRTTKKIKIQRPYM